MAVKADARAIAAHKQVQIRRGEVRLVADQQTEAGSGPNVGRCPRGKDTQRHVRLLRKVRPPFKELPSVEDVRCIRCSLWNCILGNVGAQTPSAGCCVLLLVSLF